MFEKEAEEYADRTRIVDENTRVGTDCISLVQDYEGNVIDIHERIKQAFLAGLKAGRPQWHDLQKDKKDLPKFRRNILVTCEYRSKLKKKRETFEWDYNSEMPLYAIAWCEIPTFDKE